ncbi:MAG: class I SAM-dependent methyltransferase [Gammaproteobacteria bacterium]|nr:class I SAM-dependent methyltransferase [Gammaproteobacteria bacterium]MBU1775456.1 class I SAM-dependent methyltransferase [Gammaproteobacteria bacterium]MBU1969788.1 class I SAM-dependent methyltransferase [Gammaproteobacteria bacterium]
MPTNPNSYWQGFAQRWNRLGSPLRPNAEDVANFRQAMGDAPGRSLLLGVTPELADLAPDLTAIDNSAAMIAALWHDRQKAVLGDWLDMPFPPASFDTLIGDGCLVLLAQPGQHRRFFEQLAKVIAPGGKILLRVFVNPEQRETREQVCNDALAGKIEGVHAFKWRLSMAIASESTDYTLSVAETAATFDRLIPDRGALAAATGWRADEIETIDFYRGSDARYCYPTLAQVRKAIPPTLKEHEIIYGSYELAERCPILVLGASK